MHVALATSPATRGADLDDAVLIDALERSGHRAVEVDWRTDADWSSFDTVFVRTTWDYPDDRDGFVAWAAEVEAMTPLWNPADVVRWNTHKGYLLELEDRGAPVVPTAWVGAGDTVALDALLAARGWQQAVIKPAVGAGARGVRRVSAGDADGQATLDALLAQGDALVQPFLDRVADAGELSVVLVDGEATHAVRKIPDAGEFRVHASHGGRVEDAHLEVEVVRLAEWVVAATGHDLLYARVDLVPDALGSWQLSELEATEPNLYLRHAPEAAERLVRGLERRVVAGAADASATSPSGSSS